MGVRYFQTGNLSWHGPTALQEGYKRDAECGTCEYFNNIGFCGKFQRALSWCYSPAPNRIPLLFVFCIVVIHLLL